MTNNTHTHLKPHPQLENKTPWQSYGVLLDEVDQGLRLVSKKHKWVSKASISWLGEHVQPSHSPHTRSTLRRTQDFSFDYKWDKM
ncbi:hypothetical protein Tco_0414744 [Tanacetum coccineum]